MIGNDGLTQEVNTVERRAALLGEIRKGDSDIFDMLDSLGTLEDSNSAIVYEWQKAIFRESE